MTCGRSPATHGLNGWRKTGWQRGADDRPWSAEHSGAQAERSAWEQTRGVDPVFTRALSANPSDTIKCLSNLVRDLGLEEWQGDVRNVRRCRLSADFSWRVSPMQSSTSSHILLHPCSGGDELGGRGRGLLRPYL